MNNASPQALHSADVTLDSSQIASGIAELSPIILYIYDLENRRNVWGNSQMFATLGYSPEQLAAFGKDLLQTIFHPDDWPAFLQHREKLLHLRDGQVAELEYRLRCNDGEWCWLLSREVVFRRGPDGTVRMIVGAAHDVTRRHEAEESLKASEARYRMLFESNPNPMWVTDTETLRFLEVNDAAIARYGYSHDEFLAMTIADIRPPADLPKLEEAAREREQTYGLAQHGLWRHHLKCGKIIDVEITSHVLEFKGRRAYLVLAHDVTEQQRAERELRESENRFRLALAASPVVVFEQDRDLRYTWIHNPAPDFQTASVLGRSDEELLGEDGRELAEIKRRVLETGRGVRCEVTLQLGAGRCEYDLVIEPIQRNGDVTGIACAAIDITERKQTARDMAQANRDLQIFSSAISHDLKEPLRGIGLLTKFMLEDEPSLSREGRIHLARMETLSDRLAGMIEGLLEYTRSGGSRRNEPCELGELARAAADKLRETCTDSGVELTIATDLPTIDGDCILLERLFANLISNAIKHNLGPIKRIWVGREGNAIFVRDNGPGIHPRDHERIFGLFNRLPGRDAMQGIGLGLPLVKKIVESHGGFIKVRSTPGHGTTFLIHLPALA